MLNVFALTRDAEFRTRVVPGCCMNASSPLRSGALDDERFLWEILGSAVHFIVMLRFDKVRSQSSFAFDVYRTSTFTLIATFFQFPGGVFCDLKRNKKITRYVLVQLDTMKGLCAIVAQVLIASK